MALAMSRDQLAPIVEAAAKKYGIPSNYIYAVIQRESGGRPTVASGTGPVGLMQVGKSLAKDYGYKAEDRLDPAKNVDMGARYIKQNLDAFGGDFQKAMVGYSEGTGGAKQMFAGKKPFTKQAYDSMTNKNFTAFYTPEQQAAIQAHQVANPMGALTSSQQQNTFDSSNLNRDNAATAPTQADVSAQQAGVLANNTAVNPEPVFYNPEYLKQVQQQGQGQGDDSDTANWTKAALMGAAMLAGGRQGKVDTDIQSGVGAGRAGNSNYNNQTLSVLRLLNNLGVKR